MGIFAPDIVIPVTKTSLKHAWIKKSPDGSFSRCSRAERMGRRARKVSRPLRAACRRATPRVQEAPGRISDLRGGGVRHRIGHGAGASGHGMRPVGGCWAPAGISDDVAAGTEAGSRVAALRSETGRHFPRRLRRICARDRWRRDGSPHGTATVLRNMSVGRRRQSDAGL